MFELAGPVITDEIVLPINKSERYKFLPNAFLLPSNPSNIRMSYMHLQSIDAGKITEIRYDKPNNRILCKARVFDQKICNEIRTKKLRGFSIRPQIMKSEKVGYVTHVKEALISEIALVDTPACTQCLFTNVSEIRHKSIRHNEIFSWCAIRWILAVTGIKLALEAIGKASAK